MSGSWRIVKTVLAVAVVLCLTLISSECVQRRQFQSSSTYTPPTRRPRVVAAPSKGEPTAQWANDVLGATEADYLPDESWAISGPENAALVTKIAQAIRSADPLPAQAGLADMTLLYVRDTQGQAFTVSITMDDRHRTVYLGQGVWESKDLYQLMTEAEAASGGEKKRSWPKDTLTVPHNKW